MIELLLGGNIIPSESSKITNILVTETAQVQPKEEPKTIQHKIEAGDNLSKIAVKYNTTWQRIWSKNTNLTNQDVLNIGEIINIPAPDEILAERPIYTIPIKENTPQPIKNSSGVIAGNSYTPGQCTWHTKNVLGWVPNGLGDATNWAANAQAMGYTLSNTPKVGAVAWRYGHVAAVIGVGNDTVTISEMNYNWTPYATRIIEIPVGDYKYIY